MELEGVHVEGRHAADGMGHTPIAPLQNENMQVTASCYKDEVVLRLDDAKNLPFWMQITIPRSQLQAILREMDNWEE